jgi:hypothetical protein
MKTYNLLWGGPCSSKSYSGSFQPLALQIFCSLDLADPLPAEPMNFSKIILARKEAARTLMHMHSLTF